VYSIDLPTLLQILQKSYHNGRVYAQVPYGFAGLSGGYAFVDVSRGRMVACYLLNTQKQIILSGNEAANVISSMGILQWAVGQEQQQTSTNLPSIRQYSASPPYLNPQSPAIRQYSSGALYTNPQIPAIRQYSSGQLYTNPQIPAMGQYPSDPQYTNPRLPMARPSSTGNPHTTSKFNDTSSRSNNTSSRSNDTSRQLSYQFSFLVPERIMHIDTNLLGNLARRLRRVLVLVDGQRSVVKISLILHSNSDGQQETFSILKQLEEMQIIAIKKP
jgi:hypothetical protein